MIWEFNIYFIEEFFILIMGLVGPAVNIRLEYARNLIVGMEVTNK